MSGVGWGSGAWGWSGWGGAGGALQLIAAVAARENLIQLRFSRPVYFSGILDLPDASSPDRYSIVPVFGTIGFDETPVQPVSIISVAISDVPGAFPGQFLELSLDRPMTPEPALYTVTTNGLFSADLSTPLDPTTTTAQVIAVFKFVSNPTIDSPVLARDFANPQTKDGIANAGGNTSDPLNLGSFVLDGTGDYAFDSGLQSFKKRVLRRLFTSPGNFAHIPTYGVGIPAEGKKLATSSVLGRLAAEAERQIALEPETAAVRVRTIVSSDGSGLVKFDIAIRTKSGQSTAFSVPFPTQ